LFILLFFFPPPNAAQCPTAPSVDLDFLPFMMLTFDAGRANEYNKQQTVSNFNNNKDKKKVFFFVHTLQNTTHGGMASCSFNSWALEQQKKKKRALTALIT
jgi:hypothetical protein